jgi:hypothetical protein
VAALGEEVVVEVAVEAQAAVAADMEREELEEAEELAGAAPAPNGPRRRISST